MKHLLLCAVVGAVAASPLHAEPLAAKYLYSGKLADGDKALQKRLADKPDDDEARFGLGVVQLLQSFEHLGAGLYKYGVRTGSATSFAPARLQRLLPENPNPKSIAYQDLRKLVSTYLDDLKTADATLAQVKSDQVKLPLYVGRIKIDPLGAGKPVSATELFDIAGAGDESKAADKLLIKFDRGDVCWARGYINILCAWTEIVLSLDGKETFDAIAHRFFLKVDSPNTFFSEEDLTIGSGTLRLDNVPLISDGIYLLSHVINLPIKEPKRIKNALGHLETTVAQGKLMWKYILAETDDDHEWVPNPKQTSVIGVKVTQEMVDNWLKTLGEVDQILQGKKLLPFWRGKAGVRGVNLRKVFLNPPKRLDLIGWIQGSAATPYLEKGTVTELADAQVITRLDRVFGGGGRFFGFAFWFN